MKKTFLASLFLLLMFFVMSAVLVSAREEGGLNTGEEGGSNPAISIKLQNPFNCGGVSPCTLFAFLRAIIDKILLPIGGILAVLAFIYSGFLYVTAQGNTTKLATAHKAILYTSIGTAILLGSWVLAKVIENTVNQLR